MQFISLPNEIHSRINQKIIFQLDDIFYRKSPIIIMMVGVRFLIEMILQRKI